MIIPYIEEHIKPIIHNENCFSVKLSKRPRKHPVYGKYSYVPVLVMEEGAEIMVDGATKWEMPCIFNGCEQEVVIDARAKSNATYTAFYYVDADNAKQVETPTMDAFTKDSDKVNHPNHYQAKNGIEVIDVIEAFIADLQGIVAFDIGNALKYLCRWKRKGGVEDLKKAKWYIDHAIDKESKNE